MLCYSRVEREAEEVDRLLLEPVDLQGEDDISDQIDERNELTWNRRSRRMLMQRTIVRNRRRPSEHHLLLFFASRTGGLLLPLRLFLLSWRFRCWMAKEFFGWLWRNIPIELCGFGRRLGIDRQSLFRGNFIETLKAVRRFSHCHNTEKVRRENDANDDDEKQATNNKE